MTTPTPLPKGAWYALVIVSLTQTMSLLDRQILAILAPAIKADLKVGDAEMGLLYGTVFALFYALFSLPVGRLADGWVRTRLLATSLVLWSAATALAGFAGSFAMLIASRLGVGVGEAATQPAGTSLVYDYWPKQRRGFAMAALASAIALGIGGSLVVGGLAADWWNGLYPAGDAPLGLKGWQFAFLAAAAPGFVLALFVWTLREPVRGEIDGLPAPPDPHPFRASGQVLASVLPGIHWASMARQRATARDHAINLGWLAAIVALMAVLYTLATRFSPRPPLQFGALEISPHLLQWGVIGFGLFVLVNLMQHLRLADNQAFRVITRSPTLVMAITVGSLQSVINYGMMAFNPMFLMQTYQLPMRDAALQFGLLSASLGIVGPLVWGPLSDRLNARFPGAGRAWVALLAMGISPVMALWVYHAPSAEAFYWRFVPYSLILTGWMPPLYAIMYDQVLPRMRAVTVSVYLLAMTILGLGMGPYIVGVVSDATHDLRGAMLSVNLAAVPIVVLMLLIAGRAQRDEDALLERAK